MNRMELLRQLTEMSDESPTNPATPEDLKKALDAYSVVHEFKPGDIVKLKENGGPYKREFSPGIVMETGVKGFPRKGGACQGIEESLRIGSVAPDGGFISFLVIPNYWEPYAE